MFTWKNFKNTNPTLVREFPRLLGFWVLRLIIAALVLLAAMLTLQLFTEAIQPSQYIETPHDIPAERLERKGRCSGGWDDKNR